ncbi:MAG: hypothetical protein A2569_01475 [Candidatus Vogelbacteria bacterium RIFOXYD1_FULL_51_18]|uniref:Bacterial sugar transferase domain-containing protein n=1 Tax=Candidatus Vogelbacteria bacterium RIFOXYD1_FULL_51_18 TaxID=1802440 RepID=A0A1G2QIK9_9BACT|nr:MAG: hypothetical protein A2569_01475 [Candidatus Vogelbacteria bacterium RIFOXYD1_FULL_51_18]
MLVRFRREALLLFFGDIIAFGCALYLALFLRNLSAPGVEQMLEHSAPFSIIIAIWLLVFYIFDLYGKQTLVTRSRLSGEIARVQVVNSIIAVLFFYFIPFFIIAPKTILFINLIFSTALIYIWRRFLSELIPRGRHESVVILSETAEAEELKRELAQNAKYAVDVADPSALASPKAHKISWVILDLSDTEREGRLANFYELLLAGVRFIDIAEFYEEIFDRVPLSYVDERWFLKHITGSPKQIYDGIKRLIDIIVASIAWLITLPLLPLVSLSIKLDDGGPVFIDQTRVGKRGRVFTIRKFRSMRDGAVVTRVGRWLRKMRIDEIPQLASVIRGDLALIGPRPELPRYVELYRRDIPYYDARHMLAPGLSGWAQIYHENHPHFSPALEATRDKLSYDLYYLKNRSLWLDLKIVLKTFKILLLQKGT